MDKVDNETLIAKFTKFLRIRRLSDGTIEQYPQYVQNLSKFIGGSLLDVDEDGLVEYIADLQEHTLAQSSIIRYFVGLSAFFTFVVRKKLMPSNPIDSVFKEMYLRPDKRNSDSPRQLISIDQAKMLVANALDPREKALILLLFKTGMRRHEVSDLDLENVDISIKTIHIKPTHKRSRLTVFFDDETVPVLNRWLRQRSTKKTDSFFTNLYGKRLTPNGIRRIVERNAEAVGLHNPTSSNPQDHFSPHCCRYWFTTHLRRRGMSREFIKKLRGDAIHDAVDIYDIIDEEELRKSYEDLIPQLL